MPPLEDSASKMITASLADGYFGDEVTITRFELLAYLAYMQNNPPQDEFLQDDLPCESAPSPEEEDPLGYLWCSDDDPDNLEDPGLEGEVEEAAQVQSSSMVEQPTDEVEIDLDAFLRFRDRVFNQFRLATEKERPVYAFSVSKVVKSFIHRQPYMEDAGPMWSRHLPDEHLYAHDDGQHSRRCMNSRAMYRPKTTPPKVKRAKVDDRHNCVDKQGSCTQKTVRPPRMIPRTRRLIGRYLPA